MGHNVQSEKNINRKYWSFRCPLKICLSPVPALGGPLHHYPEGLVRSPQEMSGGAPAGRHLANLGGEGLLWAQLKVRPSELALPASFVV